jgi:hypothetical protein
VQLANKNLQGQKNKFEDLAQKRDVANMNYSKYLTICDHFVEILMMKLNDYEKSALKYYTNSNEDKRIITAQNFNHHEVTTKISTDLGNPYRLMFNWIQIEI